MLLGLFAWRHLSRRAALVLLAGTIAASALAWTTSPYLRHRIADIAVEYRHGHEDISRASTAQRLTYWRKALHAFAEAPLTGHGTGSIKRQFERAATGGSSLDAEIVSNPHNQTLNVAMQWGVRRRRPALRDVDLATFALFAAGRQALPPGSGVVAVVQNVVELTSATSHLFDFHEGWMYVLGVGVAGGHGAEGKSRTASALQARTTRFQRGRAYRRPPPIPPPGPPKPPPPIPPPGPMGPPPGEPNPPGPDGPLGPVEHGAEIRTWARSWARSRRRSTTGRAGLAAARSGGAAVRMQDRAAGRPIGIAATGWRGSRPLAYGLSELHLEAARAIEHAVDHHAGLAGRRAEA